MALTLEEVRAQIKQIQQEYAGDLDGAATAVSKYAVDNNVSQEMFTDAMNSISQQGYADTYKNAYVDALDAMDIAAGSKFSTSGTGTSTSTGTSLPPMTAIRSGEGVTYSLPTAYTLGDVQVQGRPLMNEQQLAAYIPYDPRSIEQRSAYNVVAPTAITFYDRIRERPVPVVTKGITSSGMPTTGITMGAAEAQPSGELDIQGIFPGTGMNVEGTGLGGTTVGLSAEQAQAAGLPPGNTTGTILTTTGDTFVTPRGTLTAEDVIGTTGATENTTDRFITDNTGNVIGSAPAFIQESMPTPTVAPTPMPTVAPTPMPTKLTMQEEINRILSTSPTRDIAAQRIADYSASRGGLDATTIAAAVNQYGSFPDMQSERSLTANPLTADEVSQYVAANQLQLLSGTRPTDPTEYLLSLRTPAAAAGEGPYTEQESIYRIIDEAKRQGLTLEQTAQKFGKTAAEAQEVLDRYGMTFRRGGAVQLAEGGEPGMAKGIAGLFKYAKDSLMGDVPEYLKGTGESEIRYTGRGDSPMRETYYGEGPTFEEQIIARYGYPEIPDRPGVVPFRGSSTPPSRGDMPNIQELLDARAHALGSALYAKEYGPTTARYMGNIGEGVDRLIGASREDVGMDLRNNAVGRKIFRNAGIMNTPKDITKMVDDAILDQLDRIMDRPKEQRRKVSPEEGVDVYFNRMKDGSVNTSTLTRR